MRPFRAPQGRNAREDSCPDATLSHNGARAAIARFDPPLAPLVPLVELMANRSQHGLHAPIAPREPLRPTCAEHLRPLRVVVVGHIDLLELAIQVVEPLYLVILWGTNHDLDPEFQGGHQAPQGAREGAL